MNSIATIATAFSIIFFIFSPLLPNHYFPWLAFHSDFLAATALMLVVFAVIMQCASVRIPRIAIFFIVLALVPLLQFLFGLIYFLGDAVIASSYLFSVALAITAGYQLSILHRENFFRVFAIAVLICAFASAYIAMYQWFNLTYLGVWVVDMSSHGRAAANLSQPNMLCTLLWFGLVSLVFLWETRVVGSWVSSLLAIILIIAVALTQSRTGWLIGGTCLVWWILKKNSVLLKLSWIVIAVAVLFYLALIKFLPELSKLLYLSSGVEGISGGLGKRPLIWQQLFEAALQKPFFGYGWTQVSQAQMQVVTSYPNSIYVSNSHNLFLDLLIWNGFILGGFLILAIVYWGFKSAIKCKSPSEWYVFAIIAILMVHALLEFPVEYAYILFPVSILLGGLSLTHDSPKLLFCPRWLSAPIGVLSLVLLCVIYYEYRRIESDFQLMRFENALMGSVSASGPVPNIILLTNIREYTRFARSSATENMSDNELQWMKQVAHRYAFPPALFRYTLALALNGRYSDAEEEMKRIRNLHGEKLYQDAKLKISRQKDRYPK